MKGLVNNIIHNTFIDGPGSRMAIFLQGCNMRCLYCHNPETQTLCKRHPYYREPGYKELAVDDIYLDIMKCADFLDGITISGGECTLQSDFVCELFGRVKDNSALTCFLDTNGNVEKGDLKNLVRVADGFIFDIKAIDKDKHLKLTGVTNDNILSNLRYISSEGLLHEVRTVMVGGFTDSEEEICGISRLIRDLNTYTKYKLIRFRPQGVRTNMRKLPELDNERFKYLHNKAKELLGNRVVDI